MRYVFFVLFALANVAGAAAQAPVGDEAFSIIRQLYEYDATLPLNPKIVQKVDSAAFVREHFLIDGWRGSRIPGLIALPKGREPRYPVIVLIDGIGGWKERWWQHTSWNRGRVLVDTLLANGYAVIMIDAPASGDRIYENDFVTAETFIRKPAQFRDFTIQNTIEHRRVLDYLATRSDIDTTRIGALGLSVGGMTTFFLGTVEPRIKAGVAGLTPLWRFGDVTSPANYASRIRMPLLMMMGRTDSYYTVAHVDQVSALLGSTAKRVIWYDVGHRLPVEYAGAAASWFRQHLPTKNEAE